VLPEGLGKLIKIIHLIGSRTRDLPVFWMKKQNLNLNKCLYIINKFYKSYLLENAVGQDILPDE
jgi:hypothetical protein